MGFQLDRVRVRPFEVIPNLPEPLKPLLEIARNMGWSWHYESADLFVRIDRDLWHESRHNPIWVLGRASQHRLEQLAEDESYTRLVRSVHQQMIDHLHQEGWFKKKHPDANDCCVAYFCAEFGLAESFRNYSGGLGILAGDHLKSASGLGIPLVGIGLLYRKGYFQQHLNSDGWQQESLPELDISALSVLPVNDRAGSQLRVKVELPGRSVQIAVWQVAVGRVRLLLLDTCLPENSPEDRQITSQLYGGNVEMRIKQEVVLGIGGRRALAAMGIEPTVRHMNEGHAAFQALEQIHMMMQRHQLTFDQALIAGAAGNVFTTHTPVPAGIDHFAPALVEAYLQPYRETLGTDMGRLLGLGRQNPFDPEEPFNMAILALRTSNAANGVARLHGEVSRRMWANLWPDTPTEEIPIGHVTNGVHLRTWMGRDLYDLLDRYLPIRWQTHPEEPEVWQAIDTIPDEDIWRVHAHRRHRLVRWLRGTHRQQLRRRGASTSELDRLEHMFNPDAFTIGFARRFATYKRANLLFHNPDRLKAILSNPQRPVQIIFAGKAHPADTAGKELIRNIVHFARKTGTQKNLVFIENYDMAVARHLVQGADLWLNTPRRPMEASGTSGMKAAMNGVLNCSIPDGWWDEAPRQDTGWTIGNGEIYDDLDYQDAIESQALYDLLENEIIPLFYQRNESGIPREWVRRMKCSIRQLSPLFNSHRMLVDYVNRYYLPAHRNNRLLQADNLNGVRALTDYLRHLWAHWKEMSVLNVKAASSRPVNVHEALEIEATVDFGRSIQPDEIRVQVYYGPLDNQGHIHSSRAIDMKHVEGLGSGRHRYVAHVTVRDTGHHGFAVRLVPSHPQLAKSIAPSLITWESKTPDSAHPTPAPALVVE